MTLASFTDANQWVDNTKIKFTDAEDAADDANNADNIVKAKLYPVFPELVLLWDVAPTGAQVATPAIVKEAASLLMASYRYARKYSEQTTRQSNYAMTLEARAMQLLTDIASGEVALFDVAVVPVSGEAFSDADFWPNDDTAILESLDAVRITVRKQL